MLVPLNDCLGHVVNEKQACLHPDNINMLVFLSGNVNDTCVSTRLVSFLTLLTNGTLPQLHLL